MSTRRKSGDAARRRANARREAMFHGAFWQRIEKMTTALAAPEAKAAIETLVPAMWPEHLVDQMTAAQRDTVSSLRLITESGPGSLQAPQQGAFSAREMALLVAVVRLAPCDHWRSAPWRTPATAVLAAGVLLCQECIVTLRDPADNGRCDICEAAAPRSSRFPRACSTGSARPCAGFSS